MMEAILLKILESAGNAYSPEQIKAILDQHSGSIRILFWNIWFFAAAFVSAEIISFRNHRDCKKRLEKLERS